jgi:tetratricopeptide (TPR) repeat protein
MLAPKSEFSPMSVLRVFFVFLVMAVWVASPVEAAKDKEPKVSELMKDANDMVSQAQTSYINGETKQAIELYRKALAEISKIEQENPKRVSTSEFAPVRFRKALCETEIDRIMLEEVNATARTVAVTDTSALEKKREDRKKAAETNHVPEAAVKLSAKQSSEDKKETMTAEAKAEQEPDKPVVVKDELEWAKDMLSVDRFEDAEKALLKILKVEPEHRDARFLMALARVQQGKHADATVVIDDLLTDNASDEPVLLLAAGSYMATGNYAKAMETLDKAMKVNPKRPDGYLNMAWLLLEMKPGKTEEPELYYRQAVKLGGPRDRDMERRLGMKTE